MQQLQTINRRDLAVSDRQDFISSSGFSLNKDNPQFGVSNPRSAELKFASSLPFTAHSKHLQNVKILPVTASNTQDLTVGQTMQALVAEQLQNKPDSTFIFPTGNTPLEGYKALRANENSNWSQAKIFHLDEYVPPVSGMPSEVETYADYMKRELLNHIDAEAFLVRDYLRNPSGYDAEIERNAPDGVDMVILGIGKNGHIAFNEPGSDATSKTRIVDLTDATIQQNFGQYGVKTLKEAKEKGFPTQAMTLGMETILKAKTVVLLATGEDSKGDILREALDPNTPPHPSIPASYLKNHPDVLVVTDFDV